MRISNMCVLLCSMLALIMASAAPASVTIGTSLDELTANAATIMRGICESADVETIGLAGGQIRVTIYRFRVVESLKGNVGEVFTFRQVGSPNPDSWDLGRLAGLPIYHPGGQYVLLLLPESRAGLTSPSGAGEGAFLVNGDVVVPMRGELPEIMGWDTRHQDPSGLTAFGTSISYRAFRDAILEGQTR